MRSIEILDETIVPGKRLGRHREHDPRSRAFAAPYLSGPIRSVVWNRKVPAFDQGPIGQCTAAATWGLLVTEPFASPVHVPTDEDITALYSAATRLDRIPGVYPPEDTGSSGLAALHAARNLGLVRGYHHAFSFDAALRALQSGPVITGVNWYAGMDDPKGDRAVVEISGELRGGHEVEVYGVDVEEGLVLCYNSWGVSWGDRGRFAMPFDVWRRLLGEHGDVTVAFR